VAGGCQPSAPSRREIKVLVERIKHLIRTYKLKETIVYLSADVTKLLAIFRCTYAYIYIYIYFKLRSKGSLLRILMQAVFGKIS
jgi:hypothetical protein